MILQERRARLSELHAETQRLLRGMYVIDDLIPNLIKLAKALYPNCLSLATKILFYHSALSGLCYINSCTCYSLFRLIISVSFISGSPFLYNFIYLIYLHCVVSMFRDKRYNIQTSKTCTKIHIFNLGEDPPKEARSVKKVGFSFSCFHWYSCLKIFVDLFSSMAELSV